jgi:hypothetical protein
VSGVLAELADRLARLRWDPRDPSEFLGERSDLVRLLRLESTAVTMPRSPTALRIETRDTAETIRAMRQLRALLAAREQKVRELQQLLAEAVRPRPRRQRPLSTIGQLDLPFPEPSHES